MLGRLIAWFLIGAQLGLGATAMSSDAAVQKTPNTPEFALLENVIALQGENLPQPEMESQLQSSVRQYVTSASGDGAEQRFQQALVAIGLYTDAQAAQFMADSRAGAARVSSAAALAEEAQNLAKLHPPSGAQFSACDLDPWYVGGGVMAAGTLVILAGAIMTGPTCGMDNPTPSDVAACGNYPHANLADNMLIGGSIALGVGAVLFMANFWPCGN